MAFFSALHHRFREAFDPNRLAMVQAFLNGDPGTAAEQFRQLREEHERLRMQQKRKVLPAPQADGGQESSASVSETSLSEGMEQSGIHDRFGHASAMREPVEPSDMDLDPGDSRLPAWSVDREAIPGLEPAIDGVDSREAHGAPRDMFVRLAAGSQGRAAQTVRPFRNQQQRSFHGTARDGATVSATQPSLVDTITAPSVRHVQDTLRRILPPGGDGRIGNAYDDPDYRLIEAPLERRYGLPPGILERIRMRGERSNADQVSERGAQGVYQVIPSTRDLFLRAHRVDAYASPADAAHVAALHLRDSYRRHPDWNRAVLEYHGSPDPSQWGERTRAYGRRVGDVNRR